jgi:class 3 adenylate cyclase/predicted ATPase
MAACPSCGKDVPGEFPFCPFCAAPLTEHPIVSREQRKVVTVLFCDVTGSTSLGESTDPEALRALLARYFERMKWIVERHGGSVEKFIGDAVMAVFGVPVAHEDDALRACRAAVEMRDALPALGVEARIGVNTGEVVTGTEERLATGDAVNVAARLEQAARPGEVLIGAETMRLVRSAVAVRDERMLELKGKAEPVAAWPLEVVTGDLERRAATTMVGRERELTHLQVVFDQTVHDRSCRLFTILGSAGVGKSRLVAEFLATLDAKVVRGRSLSYGEGITYWPVVEILKQLATLPVDDAARPLRSLLGETDDPASAEEIAWGFRKLLEQEAELRPLIVVFDDLHWAEDTLLDLVEHVADLARDAPILLLSMARPELLERRPSWGGGKWNATTVLLEPLDAKETELLLAGLGGVSSDLRQRIVEVAEGNPLFVEEMLALVRDSPGSDVQVPPTIQALLAARLDQLGSAERAVLECGSIEGRTFHRGVVTALAEVDGSVDEQFVALVRKELVRPDKPQLRGDDAYRFRHLLIRDAAYDALPKSMRAELHRRFAVWLEQHGRELVELDEILAHHLELAHRYTAELGRSDQALAVAAMDALVRAAGRARALGAIGTSARFLERALAVGVATDRQRAELLLELGMVLSHEGRLTEAEEALQQALAEATAAGDPRLEHHARIEWLSRRTWRGAGTRLGEQREALEAAIAFFDAADDRLGLARAYKWMAEVYNGLDDYDARLAALTDALRHAEAAGDILEQNEILNFLAGGFVASGTAAAGIARIDELLRLPTTGPVARAMLHASLAHLNARTGAFDRTRAEIETAKQLLGELGLTYSQARAAEPAGWCALLQGDPVGAEAEFRHGAELFEAMGERERRSTTTFWLAEALYRQGRYQEAEAALRLADELGRGIGPTGLQAKLILQSGQMQDAIAVARASAEIARRGGILAYWFLDAAEVLEAAGLPDDARALAGEALASFERSGNRVLADEARARLS